LANDKRFVVKNGLTAQNVQFVDDINSTNNSITVSMQNSDTLSFDGNVAIGKASANSALDVQGTITANNFAGDGSALTGVDSDTLDGQDGSYYLDWTNTTNKPDPTVTVSLSGDVSGSGNATLTDLANGSISITTTVADDSHNHIIGNIDGLQTALDGKLSTSGKAADSDLLDGLNSTQFLRSDANDTATGDVTFSGNVAINTLVANSSPGAAGQMLTSNGTTTYWSTPVSADDTLALAIALG
jgi:hypothetical protein